jgi:2-keto-4-pentenoate hydratase/2-oxohepta-3-ene-1,7-dioic acid hydratase in catechol pathway
MVRFETPDGQEHFGVLSDEQNGLAKIVERGPGGGFVLAEDEAEVSVILPPVQPTAVYAIGLNYAKHAGEAGLERPRYPIVFLKAPSSCIGHEQFIVVPKVCQEPPEVDFEGELAVVIGKPARDVSEADALKHVLGYTIANDVSARRWQGKRGGGQWCRGKSFDTFCPLGPFLVPSSQVPDPQALKIQTRVNGEVMQDASTADMLFPVAELISFLSQGTTLLPGTVILTGTPEGVGYAQLPPRYLGRGDVVEVSIDGLGVLRNRVAEQGDSPDEFRV